MPEPTIAVVTALAPSSTTLAEYGLHLLRALAAKQTARIVALVEDDPELDYPDIPGVEIVPAWRFDSVTNPIRIARAARRCGADAVLLNAHFTSFGSSKPAAALGLATPLALRAAGIRTITLLHNIVETVDLGTAGFGGSRVLQATLRAIGSAVTWVVLRSDLVATTMPRYVEILRSKYRTDNVVLIPHGAFDVPAPPAESPAPTRILTFGKFGTYKRVEPVIEALRTLGRDDLQLVVAGTDSPNTPGYLADVEARLGGPDVHFTGYVPEEELETRFREATIAVFPYTGTTGSSGVLHQAGSFGCPPVMPHLGDLADLVAHEGYTGVYFTPDDTSDLARAMAELLDDPQRRREIAHHNYRAACGLPIDDLADWYLAHAGRLVHGDARALLRSAGDDTSDLYKDHVSLPHVVDR